MLFLQVSFDEYTGNHHTNTFFFLLSKMGHFQPQGQTFHSQIILDFRSLQPFFFFFALLMPCNDTKLMSSFQTLKTAYSNGSTEKEKFSFIWQKSVTKIRVTLWMNIAEFYFHLLINIQASHWRKHRLNEIWIFLLRHQIEVTLVQNNLMHCEIKIDKLKGVFRLTWHFQISRPIIPPQWFMLN